jgi:serine/threonine-protein kinase
MMASSTTPLNAARSSRQLLTQPGQLCQNNQLFRDRYQVLKALGRGGFGITFLARDVSLPSSPLCVIKQLCPKMDNPAVLKRASERFEREAKTLSQLGSHASIPRLLDYFQVEGEFYLVQEYVRGYTLAKQVKQNGPFSELAVKHFLRELLPILGYVHQQQVIHRDIKPPNLIRCEDDGRLVLIDFGAVKERIVEAGETTHKTATTQFVGTVGFAPPEQLALRPTYASDLYAVGVTCLYMLTGKPPMEFEYDAYTGEMLWEDYVHVSDHFGKILAKLLRVSLRDRYTSVEQVQRALDLEPYLDNLADCMNVNRRLSTSGAAEAIVEPAPRFSPFAQTAQQIRQWRSRLQQRQQGQAWNNGELVSSGFWG